MNADEYPSDRLISTAARTRFRLLQMLKWILFVLVVGFVIHYAWRLWQRDELAQIEWNFGWLILAGCVYLLGWLPSIWFWNRLLREFGGDVNYVNTARAYYCGHLGKFIPGKVMVLVIRAALLKDRGVRPAVAALTAAYETWASPWHWRSRYRRGLFPQLSGNNCLTSSGKFVSSLM